MGEWLQSRDCSEKCVRLQKALSCGRTTP